MTTPIERPHASSDEVPSQEARGEHQTAPVETQVAVQQLREAGFSEDQQDALTTALLRVLALWTQQATRGDLHAEQQALAQQLDALHEDIRREVRQHMDTVREDIRREVRQHADALRDELRDAFTQHADLIHTTRIEPPRQRDVPLWLIMALLVLTFVGVLLLVVHRFVGP
jgi:hypothetical protein